MKLPKLKYYYIALPPDGYELFEQSRRLEVQPVTVDVMTGRISGRPFYTVCARPDLADDAVRVTYRYGGPVYILRVPRDCIDRSALQVTEHPEIWQYAQDLDIPHCGVYRYEQPQ